MVLHDHALGIVQGPVVHADFRHVADQIVGGRGEVLVADAELRRRRGKHIALIQREVAAGLPVAARAQISLRFRPVPPAVHHHHRLLRYVVLVDLVRIHVVLKTQAVVQIADEKRAKTGFVVTAAENAEIPVHCQGLKDQKPRRVLCYAAVRDPFASGQPVQVIGGRRVQRRIPVEAHHRLVHATRPLKALRPVGWAILFSRRRNIGGFRQAAKITPRRHRRPVGRAFPAQNRVRSEPERQAVVQAGLRLRHFSGPQRVFARKQRAVRHIKIHALAVFRGVGRQRGKGRRCIRPV
ncbi:MAG: hypothetical protein BWX70_02937 [Verrucomicrobia bacterium ADurb.Bin070]|nr:MAG: hypothetical protein BWX70_02937 [Verrucomicrobia bacterium ADurb.Bin070]